MAKGTSGSGNSLNGFRPSPDICRGTSSSLSRRILLGGTQMQWIRHVATTAPEIFLFLAVAIGTLLGRVRVKKFSLGPTACTLIVAVLLGLLAPITIPAVLKSIFFGFFVFTIGYRAGPQFFASLSFKTLTQVVLALVVGATGLAAILVFAFSFHLDPGTAAGLGAGSLTQSAMMGTASGALEQLGLPADQLKQLQGNVAAGYAVTYVLGYILVLLYVPLVAPKLMGINLRDEAIKLEKELAAGAPERPGNLLYRKFQARAYEVTAAAGRTLGEIEVKVGRRAVIERVLRKSADLEPRPDLTLQAGDEVLLAGPSGAIVAAAPLVGKEIEGEHVMRAVNGDVVEVYVTSRQLHGRTLAEIVDRFGDDAHGVFMRSLTRHGQDVPIAPGTQIYVGDVMTLVAANRDLKRIVPKIGQAFSLNDRTDIAYLALGLAAGLLVGLLSVTVGHIPLTLGGGGGALVAGLVCGWLRSRRPTMGAFPPAAQQSLSDLGLGFFVAAIGLANGPAALAAIQANGLLLFGIGIVVTLTPMLVGTLFAYHVLRMNPVIICGALAGAMTVDAAVSGSCEVAESQTPVLGVAVPYAIANVVLTVLGPIIVGVTFAD
jgi:aspartate-alanine antiporter